jgi:tRNA1Val (adenine37-N6)-methyltransferase
MSNERTPSPGTGIATDAGLFGGALQYSQPESGFRSAVDSFALMHFSEHVFEGHPKNALDLGCGSGFLLLTAALIWPDLKGLGVELSAKRGECALENVAANCMTSRLGIVQSDLRSWAENQSQKFDLILSNPPFFQVDHGTLPPDPDKAMARFELSFNMSDLMRISSESLNKQGVMCCVYPWSRRAELHEIAAESGLQLYAEQGVHSKADRSPKYVLTAWKSSNCSQDGLQPKEIIPMVLEDEEGHLSPDLRAFEMKLRHSIG